MVTACGGDDDDDATSSTTDPTTTPTTADGAVGTELVAICEELDAALAARGPFPLEGFDPENPDPARLPAVADYFDGAIPIAEDALEQIRALAPPADQRADFDAYLAALDDELANTRTQIAAARAQDVAGFTATLTVGDELVERQLAALEALGAEECAS